MATDQVQPPVTTQQAPVIPPPKKSRTGFAGKTLWDWLNLMAVFLIPLMIGVFTLAITLQQNQISQKQHDSDQAIASDQQQATILKAYFDDMTDLMLNHGLRQSKTG